jgi:flagellar biosynthesis protein FliQ
MSDKNNVQLKSTETSSALWKFWNEWRIFLWGFFRPLVIIPLVVTVVSLIIANKKDVDKTLSLVLQIVAALLAAIAGKFFYDVIRNVFESNILVKKGLSAVRNLALARTKTKNISDRAKANASAEEIRNLLSLLEKDIANATQEWNDIIPGVDSIEVVYTLLAEKEGELELAKKEKENLVTQMKDEKELSESEKENLRKLLEEKENQIKGVLNEIGKLRLKTESSLIPTNDLPLKGTFFPEVYRANLYRKFLLDSMISAKAKLCKKCGKSFIPKEAIQVFCNDCLSKT